MPIANGDSIDRSTIGAHAKATVSFWHKNDWDGTRAQTFTHMSMVYEMLYLPLYFFGFFGVDAVGGFVQKRSPRMRSMRCSMPHSEVVPEVARRG